MAVAGFPAQREARECHVLVPRRAARGPTDGRPFPAWFGDRE